MSEARTCLLVTSTAYRLDILNLLCLPNGLNYRFRYHARWLDPELFRNPSVLNRMRGIIVYFYGSKSDEQPQEFIPIREVKITDTETLGDFLYLKFTTGQFFDLGPRAHSQRSNPKGTMIKGRLEEFLSSKDPFSVDISR